MECLNLFRNHKHGNWTQKRVWLKQKYSKKKLPNSQNKENMNWPLKYSIKQIHIYRIALVSFVFI